MKKVLASTLSLTLLSGAFLAGCGSDEKKESNKGGDTGSSAQELNLALTTEVPSMDSAISTDAESFRIMINVLEGLNRYGEDGKSVVPGMAESYEVSEDKMKYTFKIREGAKWSNGDAVTANDFVYSWQRAIDPKTASEYAYMFGVANVKNADEIASGKKPVTDLGIKAVDDYTLEVELSQPTPYFIDLTTFPTFFPANKKAVEEFGDKYALEANTLVYNGPFVLSEWKHDQQMVLTKNNDYWDAENVKLEKVNLPVVKDEATRDNLYSTGELDRFGLSAQFIDKYAGDETLASKMDPTIFFLRLNQKNEALKNENIRKAISMSIDKDTMVETILANGSVSANGIVPEGLAFAPDDQKDFRKESGDFNTYNAAEAKKAWEAGLKELGTDKVTINLLNSDAEVAKRISEYLQDQLQTNLPGLTVKIQMVPFKQKLDLESKLDYDITMAGWGADYGDPTSFLDMFITGVSYNQMDYSNKEYDKLLEKAGTELLSDDQLDARWDALLQAEKLLFEDAAVVPLYQRASSYVQQPYVKGLVENPLGGDMSFKWASIEGK